jgi:hypothetical protein
VGSPTGTQDEALAEYYAALNQVGRGDGVSYKLPMTFDRLFNDKTGYETISFFLPDDRMRSFHYQIQEADVQWRFKRLNSLLTHILGRDADADRCGTIRVKQFGPAFRITLEIGPPWWWEQLHGVPHDPANDTHERTSEPRDGGVVHG